MINQYFNSKKFQCKIPDLSYVLSEPVLDGFVTILIGMYSAVSSENVICLGASNTLI